MSAVIMGRDQLMDRYQLNLDPLDDQKTFQEFTEEAYNSNNIFIRTLAMDFDSSVSAKKREAINEKWISEFPGLDHVKRLDVRNRVDQRYFEAICEMKNLQSLNIWTSVAEDISSIKKLSNLKSLGLSNFSRLQDIAAISQLKSLEVLSVLASFKVANYQSLGAMKWLKSLELGGDPHAPRNLMLSSLNDFTELTGLEALDLFYASIRDRDYTHLLKLTNLKRLDAHWRMKQEDRLYIQTNHPTLRSGFFMAYDFVNHEFRDGVEWWVDK